MTRAYVPDNLLPDFAGWDQATIDERMRRLGERVRLGTFLLEREDPPADKYVALHQQMKRNYMVKPTSADQRWCGPCAVGRSVWGRYKRGEITPIYPTDDPAPEVEPPKQPIAAQLPTEGRLRVPSSKETHGTDRT